MDFCEIHFLEKIYNLSHPKEDIDTLLWSANLLTVRVEQMMKIIWPTERYKIVQNKGRDSNSGWSQGHSSVVELAGNIT